MICNKNFCFKRVKHLATISEGCRKVFAKSCISRSIFYSWASQFMPRSHIHGSPRWFHYGLNLTDVPGNVAFRSLIRMLNVVATGFDVSAKDNIGKGPFGDVSDTDCYDFIRKSHDLIRNDTCQAVCTADEQRFAAVQVRVSTNKNGLIRISMNCHGATRI